MPRRNHASRHSRARSLAKIRRIGPGLDPLADREQRAELIQRWVDKHGAQVRSRWCQYRRSGKNKTPATELVVCEQCGHRIPHSARILTTRWESTTPVLAFHYQPGADCCWTEFLFRQVRQAAQDALFAPTAQESASA